MISFLEGLKEGVTLFGKTITIVVNTLLLTIVYFTAIMLTSLVAVLMNKHFMNMNISKNKISYWQNYNLKKKSKKEYYKQF